MKHYQLTAWRLRLMLAILMFVIVAAAGVIAFFGYTELKKVAVEVSHTTVDADASQNNLQNLQKIQQKLASNKDVITRTNGIVAESQSYQYQDQIIADLKNYASRAHITITNLDFGMTTTKSPTPTPGSTGGLNVPPPAGVKTTTVAVTLQNPINYDDLLHFLKSIEQNLTKMQVSKVSLSKGSGSAVSIEALTIEVYIR